MHIYSFDITSDAKCKQQASAEEEKMVTAKRAHGRSHDIVKCAYRGKNI